MCVYIIWFSATPPSATDLDGLTCQGRSCVASLLWLCSCRLLHRLRRPAGKVTLRIRSPGQSHGLRGGRAHALHGWRRRGRHGRIRCSSRPVCASHRLDPQMTQAGRDQCLLRDASRVWSQRLILAARPVSHSDQFFPSEPAEPESLGWQS